MTKRAQQGNRVEPEPAGADHHDRFLGIERHQFADRAVHRHARAGVGRRDRRIEPVDVEQIFGIGHQHVGGVAAVDSEPHWPHQQAQILFVCPASRTVAAAHPGKHQPDVADLEPLTVRVGAPRHDFADDLVTRDQRQLIASLRQVEAALAAEVVASFDDMQVRVTDAAMRHRDEHFPSGRHGRWQGDLLQRFPVLHDCVCLHNKPPQFYVGTSMAPVHIVRTIAAGLAA